MNRPAFTLIELLVVVTLIALLAALALPALRRSTAAARATGCLANLREIGRGVQDRVNDAGGRMPVLHNRASRDDPRPALDTALFPAGAPPAIFRCPADATDLHTRTGTSYFWNFLVNGQSVDTLFSLVGGRDPARIPLVSDKEGFHPERPDRVNMLFANGQIARELKFSTGPP